jgi:putative transcriptional regulator
MSDKFFSRIKEKVFLRNAEADSITVNSSEIRAPHILDSRESTGYLTGQLLVATQVITGNCFHKSVVYVFSHNDEGAMGIIINQPIETVNFSSLLEANKLPENIRQSQMPVYFGGPVDRSRGFVIHSTDYTNDISLMQKNGVAVTTAATILQDIAAGRGPRHAILGVGYAGWTAGQLETEIAENSWISVPAAPALVFNTDDELKWATAGKSLGIDMDLYSTTIGHA